MTLTNPELIEKEKLQAYYLASRALLSSGVVGPCPVQRGFDEIIGGFLASNKWRPTHISWAAAEEILTGNHRNVQRAHGIGGRLARYDRTTQILSGPELAFDEWWGFYTEHDATVLITKKEHSIDRQFDLNQLIKLPPPPHDLFPTAGFSFKVRQKVELVWLKETCDKLQAPVAQRIARRFPKP